MPKGANIFTGGFAVLYTPESYDQRVQAYLREAEEYANSVTWPRRTTEERAQRRISDTERVAITLLRKGGATHPVLQLWIRRLANDPAYSAGLPQMDTIPIAEWVGLLNATWEVEQDEASTRYHITNWAEVGYGTSAGPYNSVELTYPPDGDEYDRTHDTLLLRLGYAVESHRDRGEDGEETIHTFGFGASVMSSLAAAVAEHHDAILNLTARGRKTSLVVDRAAYPGQDVGLLWENEHIAIHRGGSHPSTTSVYVTNKRTGESLNVISAEKPMYEI